MSLKNPNATKKRVRLPEAPLPHVFANMTPQQIFNKQAAPGDQVDSWQESYLSGYKSGHLEGWDASAPVNFQNGVNSGFVLGTKMLVAGDNYNVVNKNNLGAVISAPSLDELIEKLPHEGQISHFCPNEEGWFSKSELYKVNSAFIHSEDRNNVYLDIAKIRNRMQDPKTQGIIKGKYFKAAGEKGYELKPIVEDFDMVMGSILKPAPPKTCKKPKKDAILKQIEGAPRTPKKGKK
jgi:hypothetical protein